jgi:hypothetical protein
MKQTTTRKRNTTKKTPTPPPERNLRLNSLTNSRKTLGRIIRLYDKKEIDGEHYRALIYGLCTLLSFFKTEAELLKGKKSGTYNGFNVEALLKGCEEGDF